MNWAKQGWAGLAALVAFAILTLTQGGWSTASWIAVGVLAVVMLVLYLHYRKRRGRLIDVSEVDLAPVIRSRVIPQDVKVQVSVRDGGRCQIKGPECIDDREIQFDHKIPFSLGGRSDDADNIQLACGPCNRWKSNRFVSA